MEREEKFIGYFSAERGDSLVFTGGEYVIKSSFKRVFRVLLVRVKKITGNYSFPLEIQFRMLYSNKCDRRPVRLGPLAQLVRAVGS